MNNKLLATGVIGTVIAALCCFTPVIVVLFGAVGLSAFVGVLDYVLLPALLAFVLLTVYALVRNARRQRNEGTQMSDCCSNKNGSYDLAVVGAGSAGFSAAITAAEEGARVALLGYGVIGGTCVNVGCVPSKAMIRAMEVMHSPKAAERFDGIEATAQITDWAAIIRQNRRWSMTCELQNISTSCPNTTTSSIWKVRLVSLLAVS